MENSQPQIETIRAAHNLTIELGSATWRLVNGSRHRERPGAVTALLEASPGEITCSPAFARARQIPGEGLSPEDVARVVVGWAPESHNWHLGLLLAARPDSQSRMRWCGLASWPSGEPPEFATQAKLAGQRLARIINRPFHIVAPAVGPATPVMDTQPVQTTARMEPVVVERPAAEEPALQTPPFEFSDMVMAAVPRGYVWQVRSRVLLLMGAKAVGLLVLVGLYLLMSIGAETRGLAPVSPNWLPWLGIAVAVLLVGVALRNLWKLLKVTHVIIDTTGGEVRCQNRFTGRMQWHVPFGEAAYVLVSQTPAQAQGSPKPLQPVQTVQDVWVHLYDGARFWRVAALEEVEGQSHNWETVRAEQKRRGRRPLVLAEYDTPAHHAAKLMAQALRTDVWLDIV
jgi:hypothetical protein